MIALFQPPMSSVALRHFDTEGMRLGELAERAQLTKQLINYLVTALEEQGYIERVPDPTDGRAKIVRLTEQGRQAARVGRDIIQSIEREWASRLGIQDMHELRSLLERLVGIVGQ